MSAMQWILVAVVFGAVEIFTAGFWFLWLALAALLVAAVASLNWLVNLPAQMLVFAFITLLFIVFTRPLLLKTLKSNDTLSNVGALVGQHGVSLTNISVFNYGQVKVNGEIWTAVSTEDIEEGVRILVTGVEGVKLLIEKAK